MILYKGSSYSSVFWAREIFRCGAGRSRHRGYDYYDVCGFWWILGSRTCGIEASGIEFGQNLKGWVRWGLVSGSSIVRMQSFACTNSAQLFKHWYSFSFVKIDLLFSYRTMVMTGFNIALQYIFLQWCLLFHFHERVMPRYINWRYIISCHQIFLNKIVRK